VTQREKADLWRARAAEPEIAAIIERAKRTFRGTYHDVMASGYWAVVNCWEGWQGPDLAVQLRAIVDRDLLQIAVCDINIPNDFGNAP
jgi:hypothetical protein